MIAAPRLRKPAPLAFFSAASAVGLSALVLALTGCSVDENLSAIETETTRPEATDHHVEHTVSAGELTSVYTLDDGRYVSPPVDLNDGAEQVGIMLTLTSDAPPADVMVRGVDGDVASAWHDVTWTFHEGARLAGFSALDGVYLAVQVSVRAEDANLVDALTFAPALLEDPSESIGVQDAAANESALVPELAFVGVEPRSAWGARNHRCSTQEANNNYDRVAIHHTAGKAWDDEEASLRQAQAYHMDGRNYCDIAYHFGATLSGRIFELRPQPYRGGHTRHNNTRNIGFLFVGCFHPTCGNDIATPVMKEKAAGLLAMFNLLHDIPINSDKVRGHRDHSYASTACPGDGLYAQLGSIRERANAILAELAAGGEAEPQPEAEPEALPDPAGPAYAGACGVLAPGAQLLRGQALASCDGRFTFVHQTDGNVVLYKQGVALWASWTNGSGSITQSLVMQGDGNMVLYTQSGAALWHTSTYGQVGASLALQDDGNAVIYSTSGAALWHTHTYGN